MEQNEESLSYRLKPINYQDFENKISVHETQILVEIICIR